jgi:serine/threonine-protein kinase
MPSRCPACGSTYNDDARFCTKCGTRLQAAIETTGATPAPRPGDAPRTTAARTDREAAAPKQRAPVSPSNLAGQVLDGRYHIVKKLGEGGMSYVYLGHDVAANLRYAVKVLSPALAKDQNAMARLRREAALGMRLEHPNVCHIVRLGETEDGLVYVVMPFVDGEILADRTHKQGHIPLGQTAKFVHDMAQGLQVAHDLKIIHRDLKPENVMVCRNAQGEEYAVVMDFGLAKERRAGAELEKLTATGIILGTPEFMSPEQLRGKPLDPRTDIYSLALMAYEMLTGKLPFDGRTQQEMMIARLRSDPIPLRQRRTDLTFPAAVEAVLLKAMARNADDRYTTAPEFAQAFVAAAAEGVPPGGADAGVLGRLFGR